MVLYHIYNSMRAVIRDDTQLLAQLNEHECLNVFEEVQADEGHTKAIFIQLTRISEDACIRHLNPLEFQHSLDPVATAVFDPAHGYVAIDKNNLHADYMNISNILACLREQLKRFEALE